LRTNMRWPCPTRLSLPLSPGAPHSPDFQELFFHLATFRTGATKCNTLSPPSVPGSPPFLHGSWTSDDDYGRDVHSVWPLLPFRVPPASFSPSPSVAHESPSSTDPSRTDLPKPLANEETLADLFSKLSSLPTTFRNAPPYRCCSRRKALPLYLRTLCCAKTA